MNGGEASTVLSIARTPRRVSLSLAGLLLAAGAFSLGITLAAGAGVPFGAATAGLMLVLAVLVARSRTTITDAAAGLHARCLGLFRMSAEWPEIRRIEEGPVTGLLEGLGYRFLAGGTVGLLVGGPTVHVVTDRRRWLLSAEDPSAVCAAAERLGDVRRAGPRPSESPCRRS
ncbi:hypothetical protein [Nesterenkonia sp. F]|uniref:hypothetical protein n=1 Tax=Nesterenkonia sp. F TaxID=795955 RepID=UPI000255C9EF|nr:hypothetical protein [Nesterenkonia sp. F]